MKLKKTFLAAILSTLAVSLLASCFNNNNKPSNTSKQQSFVPADDEDEEKVYEIGDTVKEWTHPSDFNNAPLAISGSNAGSGKGEIVSDFGCSDSSSLKYTVKVGNNNQGYLSSDALEKPYFTDSDAKTAILYPYFITYLRTGTLRLCSYKLYQFPETTRLMVILFLSLMIMSVNGLEH